MSHLRIITTKDKPELVAQYAKYMLVILIVGLGILVVGTLSRPPSQRTFFTGLSSSEGLFLAIFITFGCFLVALLLIIRGEKRKKRKIQFDLEQQLVAARSSNQFRGVLKRLALEGDAQTYDFLDELIQFEANPSRRQQLESTRNQIETRLNDKNSDNLSGFVELINTRKNWEEGNYDPIDFEEKSLDKHLSSGTIFLFTLEPKDQATDVKNCGFCTFALIGIGLPIILFGGENYGVIGMGVMIFFLGAFFGVGSWGGYFYYRWFQSKMNQEGFLIVGSEGIYFHANIRQFHFFFWEQFIDIKKQRQREIIDCFISAKQRVCLDWELLAKTEIERFSDFNKIVRFYWKKSQQEG